MDQYYINVVKRAYWEGYYHGHDDAIEGHEFDIEGAWENSDTQPLLMEKKMYDPHKEHWCTRPHKEIQVNEISEQMKQISEFEKDLKEVLNRYGFQLQHSPMITFTKQDEEISSLRGSRLSSVRDVMHGEISLNVKLVDYERLKELT